MVSADTLRSYALSLPEAEETAHFENRSFLVGKKIFATLNEGARRGCVKLTLEDQDLFSLPDPAAVYAVPNKWGAHGWTNVDLTRVRQEVLESLLRTAYRTVAPKKLAQLVTD